jgi:hypothetical protein
MGDLPNHFYYYYIIIIIIIIIQGVFKFHRQTFRVRRWVQGTLRKISPNCLRRLIAEIQADEIPLPLYGFATTSAHAVAACSCVFRTVWFHVTGLAALHCTP